MISGVSLCAGGGLASGGMRDAGVEMIGAVEYDPAIAASYAANFGVTPVVAPIQDVDFAPWRGVEIGQFSPPCPSFSIAKQGGEQAVDLVIAAAGVRFLEIVRPRLFWVENVEGYARSASYKLLRAALDRLDYWTHETVVNAADYGVPQTRRRLILRAVAGGWMQPFRPLPVPVAWRGWYGAIEDLIPTLPPSAFAPWQLERLPDTVSTMIINRDNTARALTIRGVADPMFSVASNMASNRAPQAFLLSNNKTEWSDGIRFADKPAHTTTPQQDGRYRAWLETGRVVKMNMRALARFQSMPDWYQLPARNHLAARIIGNGVPWLLAQRITESLVQ